MRNQTNSKEISSEATESSSSTVPSVTNFREGFGLEKERRVLHEQGLKIAENHENSQKNRRKLAEST
uniref:Cux N-terminal domain-containing protein n=1 Tax=Daucus carota subsp. sativus TaxID=79200 RepID=A0A165Z4M7_DAUCS